MSFDAFKAPALALACAIVGGAVALTGDYALRSGGAMKPAARAAATHEQSFSSAQRDEIGGIVREYLLEHPEVLQEVVQEAQRREDTATRAKARAAITDHAEKMFNSSRQVNFGNPAGDVTLVEFFDYKCGFCKPAMSDMLELLKSDPKLKFVLTEFPVLGEGSVQAAQVAVAVRMQDGPNGKKYFDFLPRLLGSRGQAERTTALAAAKDAGLDMAQLEKDMASEEVRASLEESAKLAEALGLNGTPSYVVGTDVGIGAVGLQAVPERL